MEGCFRFPVFFDYIGLDGGKIIKIEQYFRVRRRSGGGDCGTLREVKSNIYCIAFKDQIDQQRVLQKFEHVVQIADDSLAFRVRESLDPPDTSTSVCSPAASSCISLSLAPPSDEAYVLQLDASILQYLEESPSARKELDKELTALSSWAQLHPEGGGALVRRAGLAGVADGLEDEQWRVEVDKLFERIKDGLGSGVQETETRVYQLAEAKWRLLWGDIRCNLEKEFPGVKVRQGDGGQIILEGSVAETQKAVDLISAMENLVLKRTVPHMSPRLLLFLRKKYEGLEMPGNSEGANDGVELEFGNGELNLYSLCGDKLDKIEQVLQNHFREVKIFISNSSSLTSELKLKLNSKVKEMNKGEIMAEVRFDSGNTVNIFGHTREVKELIAFVKKVILDPSCVETVVFPSPEAAERDPDLKMVQTYRSGVVSREEIVARYDLPGGLQVVVCQGDITKQCADALVNLSNEDLDHCEGVAAVLSHAGGPEIQKECSALIRDRGKIPSGKAVVTSSGNLKCKKLFHAVGPGGEERGESQRIMLEKAIKASLDLAELMAFQSIAIPCHNSGIFGVSVQECAEGIVTAVRKFGSQQRQHLSTVSVVNNRGDVVKDIKDVCDRALQGGGSGDGTTGLLEFPTGADDQASGHSVHVEILQGTIESQEVDVLVSPMVDVNPLSTRVGEALSRHFGNQLISKLQFESRRAAQPDEPILVEGFSGYPQRGAFFLSLLPWDDDHDGVAVQVLRCGIAQILATCDEKGFGSVAFPALGHGIALRFPLSVAGQILLEEIHKFKQKRTCRTPFRAHIIIHPNEKDSFKELKTLQTSMEENDETGDDESPMMRIVLLGKTGSGKSSLANTIFGEDVFVPDHSPNAGTSQCQAKTKSIGGKKVTLVDTPGFFDPDRSEEQLKPEIVRCMAECSSGVNAFLIVLKVEKFTEQEQAVIAEICKCFSEDALKYAVVVFTHGQQLPEGNKIEDFVKQNDSLSDLVKKCGGRCHVVDNKYWNNVQQGNYRSNQVQVAALLKRVEQMMKENYASCYTNKTLRSVEREIRQEVQRITPLDPNKTRVEIRQQATANVWQNTLKNLVGTTVGALLGILLGLEAALKFYGSSKHKIAAVGKALKLNADAEVAAAVVVGVSGAVGGGVLGGVAGYEAAKGSETIPEAAEKAAKAVWEKKGSLNKGGGFLN